MAAEISGIRRNLPRSYSRTLPVLASRAHAGQARVYVMAVELVRHSDSRLDLPQLVQFLNSYQRVAPLTIAELWAWPSMLKLALVENLRRLADELMAAREARRGADGPGGTEHMYQEVKSRTGQVTWLDTRKLWTV